MTSSYKLSLDFDPQQLRSDLQLVMAEDWVPHFNTAYFEGEWSGIALRSTEGAPGNLYPGPINAEPAVDTPVLARCPQIRAALNSLKCPVRSARLLKLGPGARIKEHRDYHLGTDVGEIRLHIPIATDPGVDFFLDNQRIEMKAGECWYLDFTLPHRVYNGSSIDRVHLVIDCAVDDWLRAQLPHEIFATSGEKDLDQVAEDGSVSNPEEFERFRQHVLQNLTLQEKLRQTKDQSSFARLVVGLAADSGYRFSLTDVHDELRRERRGWNEIWID